MIYILMTLMTLMVSNTILMLFHQDIPNISLFPLDDGGLGGPGGR